MSALIIDGRVAADAYVELADDQTPAGTPCIVPLARWLEQREALQASGAPIAVRLPNTAEVGTIWPLLEDRPMIELDFPTFADGRAYSQARVLRDRYDYKGEIRARGGAVVRDQLHNMLRSGINAFALRDDQDVDTCLTALSDFDLAYQPAADRSDMPIVGRLRRRHAAV
ncbi:DUF934 domain-containing protein [Solimonas marina]|uniref:DUF934 domain-containing protein n=1 Tax=Solimonas marina TaxID=2714601 RepID=A0A970BAD9_9GAMM|nr:DUF934 domain-containing protein [Solimonas marina]NKF23271.1 DUF934 domain-containing protein [Solimonas marina]